MKDYHFYISLGIVIINAIQCVVWIVLIIKSYKPNRIDKALDALEKSMGYDPAELRKERENEQKKIKETRKARQTKFLR